MPSNTDDEYYYYDAFTDYIPSTIETGPWVLLVVTVYSLACILVLPVLVTLGNIREKKLNKRKKQDSKVTGEGVPTFDSSDTDSPETKKTQAGAGAGAGELAHLRPRSPEKEKLTNLRARAAQGSANSASGTPKESKTVRFDNAREGTGAQRIRKNTASSVMGSVLSSAISNMSAVSQYSSMSRGSRSHHRGRRSRGRHGGRLDMAALRQIESQHEGFEKVNSRPLGKVRLETKRDVEAGHGGHAAPSYIGSGFAESLPEILPEHAADADDPGKHKLIVDEDDQEEEEQTICKGSNAICSRKSFKHALNVLVDVAHYDKETKKLMKLGIPMTAAGALGSVWDAIAVALISRYLGINSLSAYVITNLLIGLTETLVSGVSGSLETLCAHAIGANNYFLAGQYVQIATVVYIMVSVPFFGVWWFVMGDCIRLFRMNDQVVEIGVKYTKIVIFDYMVDGVFGNMYTLFDINGQVTQATLFDFITGATDCCMTWLLLAYVKDMDLFWIGASMLLMSTVHYFIFTLLAHCKGWLDPFYDGLLKSFALKNTPAVKNVVRTAIPLTIGYFLEYGEWEALTFFAAALGPAEVAAWGILESIWDLFEASTYGIASAGSIQLSMHLGNGDIGASKRSVGKTLYISSVFSIVVTASYFIIGDTFSALFTDNRTLQHILNATIPVVGMGKIFMNFGMISWTLVGAQGRYRLATTVSAIMSFCVTIPLAVLFCIYMKLTLDCLVGAIIIGYSTTGLVLSYVLLRSDWEHICKTIRDNNLVEEYEDADENEVLSSSSEEE